MTRPQRKRTGAAALAVAALALAIPATSALGGQPGATASEAHATVRISDFKFKPFELTVPRGAEVTFANHDSTKHEPAKAGSFDTGPIAPGRSESVRFARPGTYRYVCTIHPSMHGKIVVRR